MDEELLNKLNQMVNTVPLTKIIDGLASIVAGIAQEHEDMLEEDGEIRKKRAVRIAAGLRSVERALYEARDRAIPFPPPSPKRRDPSR